MSLLQFATQLLVRWRGARPSCYGTKENVPGQEVFMDSSFSETDRLNLLDRFLFVSHSYFNLIDENSEETMLFCKSNQISFKLRKLFLSVVGKRQILNVLRKATQCHVLTDSLS